MLIFLKKKEKKRKKKKKKALRGHKKHVKKPRRIYDIHKMSFPSDMVREFCARYKLDESAVGELQKIVDDTLIYTIRQIMNSQSKTVPAKNNTAPPSNKKILSKKKCEGLSKKNSPCRFYAMEGENYCKHHHVSELAKDQEIPKETTVPIDIFPPSSVYETKSTAVKKPLGGNDIPQPLVPLEVTPSVVSNPSTPEKSLQRSDAIHPAPLIKEEFPPTQDDFVTAEKSLEVTPPVVSNPSTPEKPLQRSDAIDHSSPKKVVNIPPPPPVPAYLLGESNLDDEELRKEVSEMMKSKKTVKRPVAWMKKQQLKNK